MELLRQKNVATYIVFPIVDADGDVVTGAAGLDSEIDAWADGSAPNGFADCTNEATEIGSSGVYYLSLSQAEMNADYIYIIVKTSTEGAKAQHILIRTMVGDPLNSATNTSGRELGVESDGDLTKVNTLDGNTAQTGDAYAIVNNGTYGNSAIETLVDDLESRLTAARAGYLDNLSAGAVATAAALATVDGIVDTIVARVIGTIAAGTHNPQSGDAYARLGAPAGASVSADIAAIEAQTDDIGAAGAGLTALGDARLANLDATISSRSTLTAAQVWEYATRTLSGFGTLVADIATAVWGAATRTLSAFGFSVTASSVTDKTGYALTTAPPTAAQIRTEIDDNSTELAAIRAIADKLDDTLELDTGLYRFTEAALAEAPSGTSGGGDATAENQTTIINHLAGIKGATFDTATDSLESIRNRGDAAWITGGGGSGASTVEISVLDGDDAAIPDVSVQIWNTGLDSLIASAVSDASGQATFALDDGAYSVKLRKAGVNFDAVSDLAVSGDTEESYTGSPLTIGAPVDPGSCRIYEYVFDLAGVSALAAVTATARLYTKPYVSTEIHASDEVEGTYDAETGLVYWEVARGATVYVAITEAAFYAIATVPAQDTARISSITGVTYKRLA
jgi:hypothetical protein